MTRLSWDTPGERFYEIGVDRGVLFVDSVGFAWNGLISVLEKSSGGNPVPYYIDGFKYAQLTAAEEFEATLDAFSSPREFRVCDGAFELMSGLIVTQQRRKKFGLSYRTRIGNDTDGPDLGYKIHIVYNAISSPTDRNNNSIKESPDPITFSWGITTTPPELTGIRPTSHFVVDSTRTDPTVLLVLENHIYGTESTAPSLPTPTELVGMFS
jgi:hypothetical protein